MEEMANLVLKDFKGQSGIIYTLTIKDAETVAADLRNKGLKVAPYHANLEVWTTKCIPEMCTVVGST